MRKYFWFVLLLALTFADNNAVDFLQTGLSARSMALGNTGVAGGGHIDTALFNPAGLNKVTNEVFSAAVQDFELAENKMLGWAGGWELFEKQFALGLIYAVSEIKGLDRVELDADERPVLDGSFDMRKNNYTLVLSWEHNAKTWYGLSLRRYDYLLDRDRAEATALDIGGRWHLRNFWNTDIFGGASLRNIGRTKVSWSTGHTDTMPWGMNYGLAIQRDVFSNPMVLNLDCGWCEEEDLSFGCGLEYDLQTLILRAGWSEQLTYGLGLHYFGLTLDYAQTTHEDLGLQQRVSLLLYL